MLRVEDPDSIERVFPKMDPRFVDSLRALTTGCLKRIPNHKQYKVMYALQHKKDRIVNNIIENVYVFRDEPNKRWVVRNGVCDILHSTGIFHFLLNEVSSFIIPGQQPEDYFTVNFEPVNAETTEYNNKVPVPSLVNCSFLLKLNKYQSYKPIGNYELVECTSSAPMHVPETRYVQFSRVLRNEKGYPMIVKNEGHLCAEIEDAESNEREVSPFPVTFRDGKYLFTGQKFRWVFVDDSGSVCLRSLDKTETPFNVLWWELFGGQKTLHSGMEFCVCPTVNFDQSSVKFLECPCEFLNSTFTYAGNMPKIDHMPLHAFEKISGDPASTFRLFFDMDFRRWILAALDRQAVPVQWNRIAMSNCSATYLHPTHCLEWYMLNWDGTYKHAPGMKCVVDSAMAN